MMDAKTVIRTLDEEEFLADTMKLRDRILMVRIAQRIADYTQGEKEYPDPEIIQSWVTTERKKVERAVVAVLEELMGEYAIAKEEEIS